MMPFHWCPVGVDQDFLNKASINIFIYTWLVFFLSICLCPNNVNTKHGLTNLAHIFCRGPASLWKGFHGQNFKKLEL